MNNGVGHYFLFQAFGIGLTLSIACEMTTMRQTIKARYHDGVLQPPKPLALADETEVQVTVDTSPVVSTDEILRRAAQVYQSLTTNQIAEVETIALDRRQFLREPAS
jgi:predicted DNA-binding antitoxin AbrB/MazE fold protein